MQVSEDDVFADLHTHTNASDGVHSPAALVRRAVQRGIQVLSVTDHDTVAGIAAAAKAAREEGIHFLTGIELSVTLDGEEIHLLAYGFDPAHDGLQRHLSAMKTARRERAWSIVERLRTLGVEVADDRLRADIESGSAVGRPHVAAALVRAGYVDTPEEAFDHYLGRGQPGYVSKPAFAAENALDLIHDAGGVGALAHPGHWMSGRQIRKLVERGLDGLETIHPSHDESLYGYYERLADGYDVATTGGSDYHGRTDAEECSFGRVGMSQSAWERFRSILT